MSALLQARTLLRHLGLRGRSFNRDLLLERLESRLGIVIDAVPDRRLPVGGISGACITTNESHVVFYPAGAADRVQLAVICHECAHLYLNHQRRSVDDVLAGTALPSPRDELAAEALGAALVHFAERPERFPSLIQGVAPPGTPGPSATLGVRLRTYYRPVMLSDERR
ncbi:MAG: ImmA/IrrE family metallo-endopeptidase [Chloroflexota bacterium]|nr:ImmA/IrrE family metallo-endopeptidase [Chloroflexota bacterium]